MRRYPGRKAGSGVPQRLFSLMPRHRRYVEPFLGSGYVAAHKKPSEETILGDANGDVIAWHEEHPIRGAVYRHEDAIELLASTELDAETLIYLDPPYHPSTRSPRRLYKHELDDAGHKRLLMFLNALDSRSSSRRPKIMISGYKCWLYEQHLDAFGWRREDFRAMTRGGPRTESIWFNFAAGESYHDVRFLGGNYRERERIKKKRVRWIQRLELMKPIDRAVLEDALRQVLTTGIGGDRSMSSRATPAGEHVHG